MRRAPWLLAALVLTSCTSGLKRPVHEVTAAYSGSVQRVTIVAHTYWFDPNRVKLKAGQDSVAFRYTALTFLSPARLNFRYILEGYDKNWTEAGARRDP